MNKEMRPRRLPLIPPERFFVVLVAAIVGMDLFVGLLGGLSLGESYRQHQMRAAVTAQNLALIVDEDLSSNFDKIDLAIRVAADEAERQIAATGKIDSAPFERLLASLRGRIPEINSLRVADAHGMVTHGGGLTAGTRVSIADREYFLRQRDNPRAGLVVVAPVFARIDKKWAIPVSRRLNARDGSFAGIIYGNIAIERISQTFARLDVGPNGSLALRTDRGELVARQPMIASPLSEIGTKVFFPEVMQLMQEGHSKGTVRSRYPADNVERTVAFRKIEGYPFFVLIGLAVDDYLTDWRIEAAKTSAAVAFFFLFALVAGWWVNRSWKQYYAQRLLLEQQGQRIQKLAQAVQQSPVSVVITDVKGRIEYVNPRFTEVSGYAAEEVIGENPRILKSGLTAADVYRDLWHCVLQGRRWEGELLNRKKNGELFWEYTRISPLRGDDGVVSHFITVKEDVTKRKEADAVLRKFSLAVEYSPSAVLITDREGAIEYVNQKFVEVTGYALSEVIGKTPRVLKSGLTPEEVYDSMWADITAGKDWSGEILNRSKSGELRWEHERISPITDELGNITHFVALQEDITNRKKAESALYLQSEIVAHAAEGIALIKASDATIEYVNEQFERLFGYERGELLGKPVSILNAPAEKSPERTAAEINARLEQDGIWRGEVLSQRKDGSAIWTYANVSVVEDANLGTLWITHQSDLTERKAAAEALREKESQYRVAIETARDGFWMADAKGNLLQVNDAYARLSGYSRDELVRMRIADLTAAERSDAAAARIAEVIKRGHADFESRHRKRDGSEWPVHVAVSYSAAAGGRLYVFITDLTERKRAEEATQLASMVYENSSEAIVVTDADNRIIAANPAFVQITGYTLAEVRGKNPRIFQSGRHDKAFFKAMWDALNGQGHWAGELWDKRKNGELHAKFLTINTIRDEAGAVFRYVGLFTDITERKRIEELVWQQANFDELTRLPNRRMFQDRLEQEAKKSHRAGLPMALLLIDLDRFKEVNDTLGHDMGDLLLTEAAHRISSRVRESDTVARLGGDEFIVILSELDDTVSAERIAQDIINKLGEPFVLGAESAFISASVGISLYPNDSTELDVLFKNADQAMYVAKTAGRNCFSYFTPALQEAAQKRLHITNDLRLALKSQQLSVFYQPIVELASGRTYKAEALLRWRHPERGMVSPADFIPLAEETGLIVPIGDWVFRQAVEQVRLWRKTYHPSFQISVNKSPVQIRQDEAALTSWPDYLAQQGMEGDSIVVEITEGLLLNAEARVHQKLLGFRDAGIQVALDDFGTGYSSLSYLKTFDIDYLKIDQVFVRNLGPDSSDMALCEAIIVMAHKLGLKVIAEGVETTAQRDLLAAVGCDYAQGYLYSKPVPPEEFDKLMQR